MNETFLNDCKHFLNELSVLEKGTFLSRGVNTQNIDVVKYEYSIKERKPKDMPLEVHNAINDHYKNKVV